MKVYNIYFSPTGGTKKVADILTNELEGEVIPVDLTEHSVDFDSIIFTQEDIAVIAVPSFGGRVPERAVKQITMLNGNAAKAVLVCVYGNRAYEDTLVELQDTVQKAGFHSVSAIAAIAEHSIAHQYAQGRPDAEDKTQLCTFAKQIQKKLLSKNFTEPQIPGNHPYKKRGSSKIVPKATKECIKCGMCAIKCPVQAIDANNPKKVDEEKCISCMRCISICTYSARKINLVMLSAVGLALKKVCSERKHCELFI